MRRVLALLLLVLFTAAFAQPQYGGTLRAGFQADPVGLDPHITNATSSRNLLENTYDTLVRFDSTLQVLPGLAESWEASEDGLSWTFHLRPGVNFHDGTPLKASDVAFSINRIKDPAVASPRADDFAVVESIDVPDDLTVVLHLSQPFSPLLAKLAATLNVIVSQATVEANGDLQNVVNGTGAFEMVEYLPQTRMVFKRNPNWWGVDDAGNQLPYLDGFTAFFYPDATARTTAVQTGSVDWIEYVPAPSIAALNADRNVEVVGGLSANFRSLYLNVEVPPFDNVLVRQALSYAIDEQAVVDLALFGTGGVPATGTTIPASNYYGVHDSPYVGQDLEKARELLAEAGFPKGFTFDLYVTSTYDFLRAPAEIIQSDLAQIGVTANIVAEDWSIYLPKVMAGEFAVTLLGESGQSDPDDFLYSVFYTDNGGNLSHFSDATLDELLERGRVVSDVEERRAIYQEAQELIFQLAPHVFLFHSAQYEAVRPNVHGYEHYPNTSYISLSRTWLD